MTPLENHERAWRGWLDAVRLLRHQRRKGLRGAELARTERMVEERAELMRRTVEAVIAHNHRAPA